MRRLIELVLLMKALLAFFSLIYIHYTFSMSPTTCLQHVADHWPRDGVLHIEINRQFPSHQRFVGGLEAPNGSTLEFALPKNPMVYDLVHYSPESELAPIAEILDDANYKNYRVHTIMQQLLDSFKDHSSAEIVSVGGEKVTLTRETLAGIEAWKKEDEPSNEAPVVEETPAPEAESKEPSLLEQLASPSSWFAAAVAGVDQAAQQNSENDEQFIVEYSLEYGLLRLSNATRERLNIPVLYVYLNPDTDKCFGDSLSRYMLDRFLGYDDLLMAALKTLAEKEDNKGYLRNLVTGEHFRFFSSWWVPRGSFVAAFFVMLLFVSRGLGLSGITFNSCLPLQTVSISMLLRYSHHQIFIFIGELLGEVKGLVKGSVSLYKICIKCPANYEGIPSPCPRDNQPIPQWLAGGFVPPSMESQYCLMAHR